MEIINENISSETKNFKHFLIMEVGDGPNDSKSEMEKISEPLPGISKYHSIWINSSGQLRGQELACLDCNAAKRCETCDSAVSHKLTKSRKYSFFLFYCIIVGSVVKYYQGSFLIGVAQYLFTKSLVDVRWRVIKSNEVAFRF